MNIIYPTFALFGFVCFAVFPTTQAVVPAPDGRYPNGKHKAGPTQRVRIWSC